MITKILDRLSKVKPTKRNEWVACCPVHDDKSPSMGIKLTDEGKILMHCFGCQAGAIEIIEAIGLSAEDLFPPRDVKYEKNKRVYFNPATVLKVLSFEAAVLSVASHDMLNGYKLTESDVERLETSFRRIAQAKTFCNLV